MKILITGGGTGGHIIPALAILEIIKEKYINCQVLYVGGKNSLEEELAQKEGYEFKAIKTGYLERKIISLNNLKSIFKNVYGLFQSLGIIKKFSPDIIIGTGGYVSGTVVLSGKILKKNIVIHEQNAHPGITNRIAGKFADKIMISFNKASNYFKNKDKIVFTGNPVRKEIMESDFEESRKFFKLDSKDFFVYSFGGSGGQRSINNAILDSIEEISKIKNLKWLHITGKNHFKKFVSNISSRNLKTPENLVIKDYMYDAPKALKVSDLIIGSAGAISITEIIYLNKPCILIPKKYTAENHQYFSAKEIQERGAGYLILEDDLNKETLLEHVKLLMNNSQKRKEMINNSRKIFNIDFENNIIKIIDEILRSEVNEK